MSMGIQTREPLDTFLPNQHLKRLDRAGWMIVDVPGSFQMIAKTRLEVDHTYQRDDVQQTKVQAIAQCWSWVACNCLTVAKRGKRFFVIDGQYRTLAASLRQDIDRLPCLVFEVTSVKEEATGFLRCNTFRKMPSAVEKFKAMICQGNPIATEVHALIGSSGYELRRSPRGRELACVAIIARCYIANADVLRRVWPIIVELSDGQPIRERVIEGLWYIEANLDDVDVSLARPPWRDRLVKMGPDGIQHATAKAAAYYSKGGAKVWASGILQELNKGMRRRLTLNEKASAIPNDELAEAADAGVPLRGQAYQSRKQGKA